MANVLIPIPSRSVAYPGNQGLSAKVRQLGVFESENEFSEGIAPLYHCPQHEDCPDRDRHSFNCG
jgi:hypothetical protein